MLGPDHPQTLSALETMTIPLERLGKYNPAINILTTVLHKLQTILPADHPRILVTAQNLAFLLNRQGKYSEALELNSDVLEKKE
ncbi:unnamed protein product, partial [Allacma fusca]